GWTTCSRPILRPRTASPHWSDWRPRSVPADTVCGRPPPPIRDVRQVLGAIRAVAMKIAALGDDRTGTVPGRAHALIEQGSRAILSRRLAGLGRYRPTACGSPQVSHKPA